MAKELRIKSDKQFILDYGSWPCWPYLPIKRKDNSLEKGNLGVLVATEDFAKGVKVVVYHVYLFAIPRDKKLSDPSIPKTEYPSVEELLDDGWRVD